MWPKTTWDSVKTYECPEDLIYCKFAHEAACNQKVKRNNMESHLRRNKYSHSLTLPVLKPPNVHTLPVLKPPNVHNPPSPPVCPVELTLSNFNDYELGNNKVWYYTPLFTHLNGYELSLKACVCSRGDGGGKYINLNLLVMKGSYDETLHWPLKGNFQVALLRCGSEEGHHTETIEF